MVPQTMIVDTHGINGGGLRIDINCRILIYVGAVEGQCSAF